MIVLACEGNQCGLEYATVVLFVLFCRVKNISGKMLPCNISARDGAFSFHFFTIFLRHMYLSILKHRQGI